VHGVLGAEAGGYLCRDCSSPKEITKLQTEVSIMREVSVRSCDHGLSSEPIRHVS
jgi:hypothetical protein